MIIKNVKIVLPNKILKNAFVQIKDKRIFCISKNEVIDPSDSEIIDATNQILMPGFIDCHVHGGYGVDFETGDQNRFSYFASKVVREGITGYVQASVTNSLSDNKKFMSTFKDFYESDYTGARCLGIHMEGPFIDKDKKGAHDIKLLQKPDWKTLDGLNKLSGNNIKIVTYASDLQNGDFTKAMLKHQIIPSAGHSNMKFAQFENDYLLGIRHVTHLFNGMSGIDHYRPGLAAAAMSKPDVLCEVISDGIHLHEDLLKFIYNVQGADNICIITDAINAKGLKDGEYKIGNLKVIKKGIEVRLKENSLLAGSGSTYDHNVRVFKKACDIDLISLAKMTSLNVARQLKIDDQVGSIEVNKLASLVILNNNLEVQKTIVEGAVLYSARK